MTQSSLAKGAPSPCIKQCALDPAGAYCIGCGRTLKEIASWSFMPQSERLEISRRLQQRGGIAPPSRTA